MHNKHASEFALCTTQLLSSLFRTRDELMHVGLSGEHEIASQHIYEYMLVLNHFLCQCYIQNNRRNNCIVQNSLVVHMNLYVPYRECNMIFGPSQIC